MRITLTKIPNAERKTRDYRHETEETVDLLFVSRSMTCIYMREGARDDTTLTLPLLVFTENICKTHVNKAPLFVTFAFTKNETEEGKKVIGGSEQQLRNQTHFYE